MKPVPANTFCRDRNPEAAPTLLKKIAERYDPQFAASLYGGNRFQSIGLTPTEKERCLATGAIKSIAVPLTDRQIETYRCRLSAKPRQKSPKRARERLLTPEILAECAKMRRAGKVWAAIAQKYGVSESTACQRTKEFLKGAA